MPAPVAGNTFLDEVAGSSFFSSSSSPKLVRVRNPALVLPEYLLEYEYVPSEAAAYTRAEAYANPTVVADADTDTGAGAADDDAADASPSMVAATAAVAAANQVGDVLCGSFASLKVPLSDFMAELVHLFEYTPAAVAASAHASSIDAAGSDVDKAAASPRDGSDNAVGADNAEGNAESSVEGNADASTDIVVSRDVGDDSDDSEDDDDDDDSANSEHCVAQRSLTLPPVLEALSVSIAAFDGSGASDVDEQNNDTTDDAAVSATLHEKPNKITMRTLAFVCGYASLAPSALPLIQYVNFHDAALGARPFGEASDGTAPLSPVTGLSALSGLRVLVLSFNALESIAALRLGECTQLQSLQLGGNRLRSLDGLGALSESLTHLDVSDNLLADVGELRYLARCCAALTQLDASGNSRLTVQGAYRPSAIAWLPLLEKLDGSAVTSEHREQAAAVAAPLKPSAAPHEEAHNGALELVHAHASVDRALLLQERVADAAADATVDGDGGNDVEDGATVKDGETVDASGGSNTGSSDSAEEEKAVAAVASAFSSSSSLARAHAHMRMPVVVGADVGLGLGVATQTNWRSLVTHLEMNHTRLGALLDDAVRASASTTAATSLLRGFDSLRMVHMNDSHVTQRHISELSLFAACTALEELSLEENDIDDVTPLMALSQLVRLDVSRNRIASLPNMSLLAASLRQLSIEDNYVASLAGIEACTSLVELYASNNRIASLDDILFLKPLDQLVIVDLSGNPIAAARPRRRTEYRSFVVYQLRKLKILDGNGVDPDEVALAKQMYYGRLTTRMIDAKLSLTPPKGAVDDDTLRVYRGVGKLDMSGNKLRIVDLITTPAFPSLTTLVLDNNMLSDLSKLAPLPSLSILRLNKNRISFIPIVAVAMPASTPSSYPLHNALNTSHGGGSEEVGVLTHYFPNLEVLELGYNRISSIAALNLTGLRHLRVLTLNNNDLSIVDGLQGLPSLQQLVLATNKIKRISQSSFVGNPGLRGLQLESNELRTIANMTSMLRLRSLFLANNRITDLAICEYVQSSRLSPVLAELTLKNNPVTRKQLYRPTVIFKVTTLAALDGQPVTADERARAAAMFEQSEYGGGMAGIGVNGVTPVFYYADPQTHANIHSGTRAPSTQTTSRAPIRLQSFNLDMNNFNAAGGERSSGVLQPMQPYPPSQVHSYAQPRSVFKKYSSSATFGGAPEARYHTRL
jgi:Leucine-rich repeat (LRR) protein